MDTLRVLRRHAGTVALEPVLIRLIALLIIYIRLLLLGDGPTEPTALQRQSPPICHEAHGVGQNHRSFNLDVDLRICNLSIGQYGLCMTLGSYSASDLASSVLDRFLMGLLSNSTAANRVRSPFRRLGAEIFSPTQNKALKPVELAEVQVSLAI